jgi:molybdate transport system substrate-binding protein
VPARAEAEESELPESRTLVRVALLTGAASAAEPPPQTTSVVVARRPLPIAGAERRSPQILRCVGLPRRLASFAALALLAAGCGDRGDGGATGRVRVFAAASLVDVAGELATAFESRSAARVEPNLAASNTLAQQILAAPGADVFLSADLHWMEVLERAGRVVAGSRRALLGNDLVLIAASDSDLEVESPGQLLAADFRFLALADPEAVPAGRYARGALEEVVIGDGTLWQAVADRVAPALDVRAALALVESDPEILGIVYGTDARQSDRVRVLYRFPARGAARVTYYGALVEGGASPVLGRRFLDFLVGPEGRRIAERHGFGVPAA